MRAVDGTRLVPGADVARVTVGSSLCDGRTFAAGAGFAANGPFGSERKKFRHSDETCEGSS
jgi:hypothetical protein